MYQEIEHIFFDLDHTLWDFEKNSSLAFERVLAKNNISLSVEDFMEVYNPINVAYWKLYERNEISQEDLKLSRLRDSFQKFNFNFDDVLLEKISDDFIATLTDNNHLIHGTIEVLEYLKPKYKLHIISNGFQKVQDQKLLKSKLRNYFDVLVYSEMVDAKKPNKVIFDFALKQADATTSNALMIGDSFEADILGAQNAGLKTIFFDSKNEAIATEIHTIKCLKELKNVL